MTGKGRRPCVLMDGIPSFLPFALRRPGAFAPSRATPLPFVLRRRGGVAPSRRIEACPEPSRRACPERVEGGRAVFDSPGEYVAILMTQST